MKKAFGCCAVILLMVLAAASAVQAQSGESAPDFTLKDLTGKYVSLSSYKGRPVYLVFGATWCPYCVAEIPNMVDLQTKYSPKGLVLLNIDIMESKEKVVSFVKKRKINYPVLLDEEGKAAQRYGVIGVPTKILIDRAGKVVCVNCSGVEEKISRLLQ